MQKNQQTNITLKLFLIFSISISISINSITMAENPKQSSSTTTPSSGIYIVYTEQPTSDAQPESFHLETLSTVLGSEEAAKESLIYVYKNAATGFSAKLTPEQVSELEKQPGVIQVVPSQTLQLHGGVSATNMRV